MEDKKIIINVGRQLGSGGLYIAKRLADDLGFKFYDKELLNLAAKESGFSEKFFEQNDEKKGFFRSLFHMHAPFVSDSNFYNNKLSQESLFQFQSEHSCVFVGRCADYVLRDFDNTMSLFVTADLDERVERICERHKCDADEARKIIENKESSRASYYNYYTGKVWGHATSYDLCVNSSLLGMEGTVDFIKEFINRKLATDSKK